MNVRQESLYRWQELYFPLPDVVPLSESDGTVQLHHLPAYHRDKWYHPRRAAEQVGVKSLVRSVFKTATTMQGGKFEVLEEEKKRVKPTTE